MTRLLLIALSICALIFPVQLFADEPPRCEVDANAPPPPYCDDYVLPEPRCPKLKGYFCEPVLPPAQVYCEDTNGGAPVCDAWPQEVNLDLHYLWVSNNPAIVPDGSDSPMQFFSCPGNNTSAMVTVTITDDFGNSTSASVRAFCRRTLTGSQMLR